MSSSWIEGKALVVITKVDSQHIPFETTVFVQSATGGPYAHECAHEDLQLIGCPFPLPISGKRMEIGETVRVAISYSLHYTRDYWGECDVDVEYRKVKVLRRQKPKQFYVSKNS